MLIGKTKIAAFFNLLFIAALAVAIWFYIQQQIVGERDIEFALEIRIDATQDVGDVVVLTQSVGNSTENKTITISLRGSKAELDEIFRVSNVATITLAPKAADFAANKKFMPLKMDVAINAANLKLPPEVKIVSTPIVSVVLARRIEKNVSVAVAYSEDAQKLLLNPVKEVLVHVSGPRFILDNPEWSPVTETITKDRLPLPGKTNTVTANIITDAREYLPGLAYPVNLDFDKAGIEVVLTVAEDNIEIVLEDLPVGIAVDGPEWLKEHRIKFNPPNVKFTLKILIPRSKDKILSKENVRIVAVFTGKYSEIGDHPQMELRIDYTGGAEWPGRWPTWAKIISHTKEDFTVWATVTKIQAPTPTE